MRSHRRHAFALVLVLGIAAFVAQVAGVGTTSSKPTPAAKPVGTRLATLAGAAVPDIGSTKLAASSLQARAGDVLRMRAVAKVAAGAVGRSGAAQVVCGIRYSRAGDASWSLGDPYETVVLKRGGHDTVTIERSFDAPASDTYRMSTACHVASPTTGATVTATGTMQVEAGLPAGAATPIG